MSAWQVEVWVYATAALVALGAGSLIVAGGILAAQVGFRVQTLRQGQVQRALSAYRTTQTQLPEHVRYGYPNLPWDALGLLLAVMACAVLWHLVGMPYAAAGVGLLRLPHLLRRALNKEGQQRMRLLVRDFVDDLREAHAICGSLGRALEALVVAADQGNRRDALALALRLRARSRTAQMGADQVLAQMAADLASPDLADAADQVRLALAAGMDLGKALAAVADNLSEVIAADVNVRLQAAPNTYLMPMVIFMFGPLLILMLFPLALRITSLLTVG